MSSFLDNNPRSKFIMDNLLTIYDKFMVLKIFVDSDDAELKDMYYNAAFAHNTKLMSDPGYIDAGFDLFAPGNDPNEEILYGDKLRFFGPGWGETSPVNKLDFKICCSAKMFLDSGKNFNTGYYMHPRSSLSKTQLRLANSTGIIDAGYRGHLMGMFDVVNIKTYTADADYFGKKYERYLQICAPGLVPIIVDVVNTKEDLGIETARGEGGFGSTGT
jgi:dUTP pyrophosphatase